MPPIRPMRQAHFIVPSLAEALQVLHNGPCLHVADRPPVVRHGGLLVLNHVPDAIVEPLRICSREIRTVKLHGGHRETTERIVSAETVVAVTARAVTRVELKA